MGLRDWIDSNSTIVASGSVALFVVAVVLILWESGLLGGSGVHVSNEVYYFDLTTKKLIVVNTNELPPITTASGHQAVQAYVFSCTGCSDRQTRFIGWLSKFPPKTEQMLQNPKNGVMMAQALELVRTKQGTKWYSINTKQGQAITDHVAAKHCKPGQTLISCWP